MKLFHFCYVLLILAISQGSAWAEYYSWSAIAAGPPDFGYVEDEGANPTHVSVSDYGKDAAAQGGWWDTGARFHNTWDNSYQGWMWVDSNIEKDFVVTSAGPASLSFSLNGTLQANANPEYDNQYFIYSSAGLSDYNVGNNPDIDWYDELDTSGILPVAHNTTYNYNFSEDDIGDLFTISLYFDTEVSNWPLGTEVAIAEGDSLEFISSFFNGFKIDSITGGIAAAEGPAAVPIPASLLLFSSAIVILIGIRRKS